MASLPVKDLPAVTAPVKTCTTCGQPLNAWTRMPFPDNPTEADRYRTYLGNVLIAHGWITYDGLIWQHAHEGDSRFDDKQAIARELGKLRSGMRGPA